MVYSNCFVLGNALKTQFEKYLPRVSMAAARILPKALTISFYHDLIVVINLTKSKKFRKLEISSTKWILLE